MGTFHSLALRYLRELEPGEWEMPQCLDIGSTGRAPNVPAAGVLWAKVLGWDEIPGLNGAKGLNLENVRPRWYAGAVGGIRAEGIRVGTSEARVAARAVSRERELPELLQAWDLYEEAKDALWAWDFADVLDGLWFDHMNVGEDCSLGARVVIVDESQDNCRLDLSIATHLAKESLVLIGDARQAIFAFRGACPEIFQTADVELGAQTLELRPITVRCRASSTLATPSPTRRIGLWVSLQRPIEKERRKSAFLVRPPTWVSRPTLLQRKLRTSFARARFLRERLPFCVVRTRNWAFSNSLWYAIGFLVVWLEAFPFGDERRPRTGWRTSNSRRAMTWRPWSVFETSPSATWGRRSTGKSRRPIRLRIWMTGAWFELSEQRPSASEGGGLRLTLGSSRFCWRRLRGLEWPEICQAVTDLLNQAQRAIVDGRHDTDEQGVYDACHRQALEFSSAEELDWFAQQCRDSIAVRRDDEEGDPNRVVISTVHRAKGLEWRRVYVSLTAGMFPHGNGARDEEERLFYVAATRARDALIATWSRRTLYDKPGGPSRFVDLMEEYRTDVPVEDAEEGAEELSAEAASNPEGI